MLKPKFVMLDEIDSGLDVDAIKAIANQINESKNKDNTMVIPFIRRLSSFIFHLSSFTIFAK